MEIASDILYRFARATAGAQLDGTEALPEIPKVLQPILQIPGPIANLGGFSITENQRESFAASTETLQAASSAQILTRVATFGRALWRIQINFTFVANYTQLYTTTAEGAVELVDADVPTAVRLLGAFAVANVPQVQQAAFDLLIPVDGWQIRLNILATGVGETQAGSCSIRCNRLH